MQLQCRAWNGKSVCSCSAAHRVVSMAQLQHYNQYVVGIIRCARLAASALVPRTLCNTKIGLTSVINEYMQLLKNKHLQWKC